MFTAVTVTIILFSAEKNTDESLFPKYFSEKLFSGMILSSQLRTPFTSTFANWVFIVLGDALRPTCPRASKSLVSSLFSLIGQTSSFYFLCSFHTHIQSHTQQRGCIYPTGMTSNIINLYDIWIRRTFKIKQIIAFRNYSFHKYINW